MRDKKFIFILLCVSLTPFEAVYASPKITPPQAAVTSNNACRDLLQLESLERMTQSAFYSPSTQVFPSYSRLNWMHDKTTPQKMKKIRAELKNESGFAVEALPLIIKKEIWQQLEGVATQRASSEYNLLI